MPSSTLIRWAGLAAVVAEALFTTVNLINLFALVVGRDPTAIVIRVSSL